MHEYDRLSAPARRSGLIAGLLSMTACLAVAACTEPSPTRSSSDAATSDPAASSNASSASASSTDFARPRVAATSADDDGGNLTLYISNQSAATNPVDIEVRIDGQVMVNAEFGDKAVPVTQPGWKKFRFALATGPHRLVASSNRGGARLEETFEINGPRWLALAYWAGDGSAAARPGQFTLRVSEQPIAFY